MLLLHENFERDGGIYERKGLSHTMPIYNCNIMLAKGQYAYRRPRTTSKCVGENSFVIFASIDSCKMSRNCISAFQHN